MKILVTGAAGQVGHELLRLGSAFDVVGFPRAELDITDLGAVTAKVREVNPGLIINAAAYTAVDKAESEEDVAFAVNRDGAGNLAAACAEIDIPLIHISTDYVFDGSKDSPYVEDDPVKPANVYGRSKEAGEAAVREKLSKHIIMRTSWVFGAHGPNFVKSIIRLSNSRDKLGIVDDQYGGPTSAQAIAKASLIIAATIADGEEKWGTYHFSGAPVTTWYGFTNAIIAEGKALIANPPEVDAITTEEYPTPASRPLNSRLDCEKIRNTFGIPQPSWEVNLKDVLDELVTLEESS